LAAPAWARGNAIAIATSPITNVTPLMAAFARVIVVPAECEASR
jgi:hypothetical protein